MKTSLNPDLDTKFHVFATILHALTCMTGKHVVHATRFNINCPLIDSVMLVIFCEKLINSWREGHCLILSFCSSPQPVVDIDMRHEGTFTNKHEEKYSINSIATECADKGCKSKGTGSQSEENDC